jgi:glycosyltransferase 2 family protein
MTGNWPLISTRLASEDDELRLERRFFAVGDDAQRDRRPTDVLLLVTSALVVLVFAARAGDPIGSFEQAFVEWVQALPSFLDPVWRITHDVLRYWVVVLVLVTLWRRRWWLFRDLVVGVVVALAAAMVVGRIVGGDWPDISDGLFALDRRLAYPALGLALNVATASIASTHLTRPYRYLSRWIIAVGAFGAFTLGVSTPTGSIGAVALGFAVAAIVHLLLGSPGGLPSLGQVKLSLAGIGVDAEPTEMRRQTGVVTVSATAADGRPLDVKIYGRDAWDGQLLVSLWRVVWYREGGPTLSVTRLQQVEHEAFLTLLAERRGASVHPAIAAGADAIGDALLVVERHGRSLRELDGHVDASMLPAMWEALRALHASGVTHGALDLDRIFVCDDGPSPIRFADLSSGQIEASDAVVRVDHARLLSITAAIGGTDAAVAAALDALGPVLLADASSYVQPAALNASLRRDLAAAEVEVDELRKAILAATGGEERDLQRLRRLTWGRALMAVLLFIAANTLVSGLLSIGLDTLWDAFREASFPIVVAAFFISLLSRPVNAYGLTALAPTPVPLGRLTMLMFAMNFVNLAMPATAGRVAVNIRFFQRSGVDPTTAVAIGALDGFTGFICQSILAGSVILFGLGSLDLQLDDAFSFDGWGTIAIAAGVAVVVGLLVVGFVPKLRGFVIDNLRTAWGFVSELIRTPKRLAKQLAANMTSELIYSVVLLTVLAAYDQSVAFPDVVLVGIGVSLFAGLMPIPGGIGVTEAGLTAGFMAAGVPQATAFAAALTVRLITYYIPPSIGFFALRWLQRRRYL